MIRVHRSAARLLLVSFPFVFVAIGALARPQAAEETIEGIPNYRRLAAEIAVGGQPTDEALAKLRELGFRTVLNLRTPEEGSEEERAKVEALGLAYYNIPVTSDSITDEKAREFARILREAEKPILVHCKSSNRVGALWFIHRSLDDGLDEEKSLEEAKKAGLRSESLERIVREFVRERKKAREEKR